MPANARFCPECGRTNTAGAEAASPPETVSSPPGSLFSTPMDPGMFGSGPGPAAADAQVPPAEAAASTPAVDDSPELVSSAPQGGTPTINIGRVEEQGPAARPEAPWQ